MSQPGIEPVQRNRVSRQCFSQVFDCPVQGLTVFPGYFYGKMIQEKPVKQRIIQLAFPVYRKSIRTVGRGCLYLDGPVFTLKISHGLVAADPISDRFRHVGGISTYHAR